MLELTVVLAVMAVLLTIAVPSYRQYAQRADRAEAIRLMLAAAGCQERIRADRGYYDTSRCIDSADNDHYTLSFEPADNSASMEFVIVAEPAETRGNLCGNLSLDHTGARGISAEGGSLSSCWGGR